jgi:hypothetical protein
MLQIKPPMVVWAGRRRAWATIKKQYAPEPAPALKQHAEAAVVERSTCAGAAI